MPAESAGQASARIADDIAKGAKKKPAKRANGAAEADHFELAQAWIGSVRAATGWPPVYSLGSMWTADDGLWKRYKLDAIAVDIARRFAGTAKLCRRASDFAAIARTAASICEDDHYFEEAPPGVAGPEYFWRIDDDGAIRSEPLSPIHRQRMRVAAEPDFEAEAVRFDALLEHAFGTGAEGMAQRNLLQVLFGAALSRTLWRQRIAVLLLGKTSSGKSTLLNILQALFPADQVGATSPQRWDNEYYVASLAGKTINVVGELDPDKPISAGAFKAVTGRDVLEGRHPTHRPFSFVCQAAHFFNANRPPPTTDRSDAFFRRWRIVYFENTVAEADEIEELDKVIVGEEIGQVLAWMLRGAEILARDGRVPETATHRRLLAQWRNANNSALQFLLDPGACEIFPGGETSGADLYRRYQDWASEAGVRPFGRNGFYEAIDAGGGGMGVYRKDGHAGVVVVGVMPK